MMLTDDQIDRYARQLILPEIGGAGQARLLSARVLVAGAGGLGAPALSYLAAAGVGTLGVIDNDVVDLTNLHRQIIHDTAALGRPKVDSAAEAIARINPEVTVERHALRLDADNVMELVSAYDLTIDGTDNFATRFLLNDACHLAGRPLISASMLRFEGQISLFQSHRGAPNPCYRCLFPAAPPPGTVPSCAEAGILGALPGVMGSLQAAEALKTILEVGRSLSGRLVLFDALGMRFDEISFERDPECALCGDAPTIRDLSAHRAAAVA